MTVFELRVMLLGAESTIWRQVRVSGNTHLSLIHLVLQMVMGWQNRHLHEFVGADRKRYGDIGELESQPDVLDEKRYCLNDLVNEPGDRCLYIYDFGDDWVHEIVLETVLDVEFELEAEQFRCPTGQGACPPEDCGGVPGYLELLDNFNDLDAIGHDEAVALLGELFEPEAFDCALFNELILKMRVTQNNCLEFEAMDEEMAQV